MPRPRGAFLCIFVHIVTMGGYVHLLEIVKPTITMAFLLLLSGEMGLILAGRNGADFGRQSWWVVTAVPGRDPVVASHSALCYK